jgi:hypothetical protein
LEEFLFEVTIATPGSGLVQTVDPIHIITAFVFVAVVRSECCDHNFLWMAASSSDNKHFDLIVIGAGSGGVSCAERAIGYGASVAVFEGGAYGGTCVNVGL